MNSAALRAFDFGACLFPTHFFGVIHAEITDSPQNSASGSQTCSVLRFKTPNDLLLEKVLAEESAADVTYSEVGATKGQLPSGYLHDRASTNIGTGRDFFDRAGSFLMHWGLQDSVGFNVYPNNLAVSVGQTILLTLHTGPLFFVASARVIYVVDEPNRRGFAYGTLPTHPEIGEEYFGVAIDKAEQVKFEIFAFSRPGSKLTRLGRPVSRRVQKAATRKYLHTMETQL